MLVVGNWKMNTTQAEAVALAAGVVRETAEIDGCGIAVCPPFVWLDAVAERVRGSRVKTGAQNVSAHESGAYTGEVSAAMLSDLGCAYAIVGHSERRALFGESDPDVAARASGAMRSGLVPIVCVGETLDQRKAGQEEIVVNSQLTGSLEGLLVPGASSLVVAYEPVWAIGTGETASPEQAQHMHATIRQTLRELLGSVGAEISILYGGSVKPANAAELFGQADVDGGLVGGASLDAAGFAQIVREGARMA